METFKYHTLPRTQIPPVQTCSFKRFLYDLCCKHLTSLIILMKSASFTELKNLRLILEETCIYALDTQILEVVLGLLFLCRFRSNGQELPSSFLPSFHSFFFPSLCFPLHPIVTLFLVSSFHSYLAPTIDKLDVLFQRLRLMYYFSCLEDEEIDIWSTRCQLKVSLLLPLSSFMSH